MTLDSLPAPRIEINDSTRTVLLTVQAYVTSPSNTQETKATLLRR